MKEAGAENLEFELLNRDVDQPYKYVGIWLVDEWSKIGVKVDAEGRADRPVVRGRAQPAISRSCCRPIATASSTRSLDVQPYLPSSVTENYGNYEDPKEDELYDKVLHETDPAKQKQLMSQFAKHVMDTEAHKIMVPVVVPDRPVPLLRQGLEDQPEPLHQPGSRERLARQAGRLSLR